MRAVSLVRSFVAPAIGRAADPLRIADLAPGKIRQAVRSPATRFIVRIDKAASYRYTAFGTRGDSHHQKACAIYIATGSAAEVRLFLAGEMKRLRPMSLAERLFASNDPTLSPLTELSALCRFLPWEKKIRSASGFYAQGEHTFGPISQERLAAEAERMTRLVDSLRDFGYRPERFPSGYVRGYVLLRDDDHRFLVTEGMHRLSAMAALGVQEIEVRPAPKLPACVDVREVDTWPHVRSGYCSRELALRMVDRYFG